MRYSTRLKGRSRLQGHRKRRRSPEVVRATEKPALDPVGYKALRQYPSVGDMLDEFRLYGFSAGVESMLRGGGCTFDGAHEWITEEVVQHE